MKKRIMAILLSVVIGITAIPTIFIEATEMAQKTKINSIQVNSKGIMESGSCGENATYTLVHYKLNKYPIEYFRDM